MSLEKEQSAYTQLTPVLARFGPWTAPVAPHPLNWKQMSQPLVGMDLADLREALGPDQPGYRARQIYDALYREPSSGPRADHHPARRAAAGSGADATRSGCRTVDQPLRIDRRHPPLPAAPGGRPHRRNRADAGRRARHHLHLEPGGLPGGLQVLHDRAAGPGAQPHGRRNRRPGAAGGAREPAAAGRRPAEHRHDGAGRAAAQPAPMWSRRPASCSIPEGFGLSPRRITVSTAGHHPARSPNWAASRCGPNSPSR